MLLSLAKRRARHPRARAFKAVIAAWAKHYSLPVPPGDTENSDDDAVNTEEKIWDLTQSINVKGVWYGCKHGVLAMRNVCSNS